MANLITSVSTKGSSEYELFIKPFLEDPIISSLPMTFKMAKLGLPRDVYFNTQLDKVARGKTTCGWDFVGGAAFTKKPLTPIEIGFAVEQCYTVFANTIFADGLPDGYQRGELSQEIRAIMMDLLNDAINRDLLSILLLGDTAVSESTDYYSLMDGFYKKLSALDGTVYDAGTVTDTELLPANIEATMYKVFNAQSPRLRQVPANRKKFIVTGSVYDAWNRYIQIGTNSTGAIVDRTSILNGVAASTYQGIELVPLRIVDERLTGDPALITSPLADENRIVLTMPENHFVGMDGEAFSNINMWYENKDDKFYATASALLAYEYGYDDLNVIAGFNS